MNLHYMAKSDKRLKEFKKSIQEVKGKHGFIVMDDINTKTEPKTSKLEALIKKKHIPFKIISSSKIQFDFAKAKSEIYKITVDLINKKDRFTTNSICISKAIGIWEEKNCAIPEERFQKLVHYLKNKFCPPCTKKGNLLSPFNRDEMIKTFSKFWDEISKDKECKVYFKKKKLLTHIKEYMGKIISPTSLKYDTAKNFAKSIADQIITGKKQEYKNDGRPFEINQQVEYKTKKGILKTGKVMKIFMCDIYYQRVIVVKDNETLKSCNRKDKSIIRIIK